MSSYDLKLLGSVLGELSPLITEALQALDKPGTRALRRKIDGRFHFAVGVYDMVRRMDDDSVPHSELPHYERVTEVWPASKTLEARKAAATAGDAPPIESPPETPAVGRGLRLVVDNGCTSRAVAMTEGGAA